MAHRVNFVLDNHVWDALQDIPKGERSKFVNHAVGNDLQACRRKKRSDGYEINCVLK